MVDSLIRLVTWIERTLRLLGFVFRLVLIACVVALLARLSGLIGGELLQVFWIAVAVGLVTIAMPSFVYGYESRIDDQFDDDIAGAKAKRERSRK